MNCPKCGTRNDADAIYCLNCGNRLLGQPAEAPVLSTFSTENREASEPIIQRPDMPLQEFSGQSEQAVFNVWGPFAGRGTQRSHNGWLMDNKGECASDLVQKVKTKFNDRQVPDACIDYEYLTAKGLIVEQRPYFLLKRRMTTVGLYITQFGKDLFISIASYLKPPISLLRVVIVSLMVVFGFYTLFIMPAVLDRKINSLMSGLMSGLFGGNTGSSSGLMSLVCVVGPLGTVNLILLGILLLFSVYKYISEKDFFAALRTKSNEFDEDDLMAMEKAVEQTVRIAMDEIGLDSNDLIPLQTQETSRLI